MNMGAENCGLQKGGPMMNNNYRSFFGLNKQPFGADINLNEILKTAQLIDVKERFDYVIRLGAIGLITGEVGSGKSTAIRYAAEHLHPSEYKSLYMTASSGAIMELYRQLVNELGIYIKTNSKTMMLRLIKKEIGTLVCEKKIKVVLLIDEASLMRLEVFAELHTLCQFEKDSKPYLPIILAGQNNLIDKLSYRSSQPLASRVVARSHLQGTDLDQMNLTADGGILVNSGATLMGNATINTSQLEYGGKVIVGATGSTTGLLTLDSGNLVSDTGGELTFGLTGDLIVGLGNGAYGQNSLINVASGTADFTDSGSIVLEVQGTTYIPTDREFTIIETSGGITGDTSVTTNRDQSITRGANNGAGGKII